MKGLITILFAVTLAVQVFGQGPMPPTNRPTVAQWMATHTNAPNTNHVHQVGFMVITWQPTGDVWTSIERTTNNPQDPLAQWVFVTNVPVWQTSITQANDGAVGYYRARTLVIHRPPEN